MSLANKHLKARELERNGQINVKNVSDMQLSELHGEKKLVYNCQESYLKQKYEIKNAKGVNNYNLLIYYTCLLEPSFILRLDLGYLHPVAANEAKIF